MKAGNSKEFYKTIRGCNLLLCHKGARTTMVVSWWLRNMGEVEGVLSLYGG